MKKTGKRVGKIAAIICLVLAVGFIVNTVRSNDDEKNDQFANADTVVSDETLKIKQYDMQYARSVELKKAISNETEIVLLTVSDLYVIAHDKTPDNSTFEDFFTDSNMTLSVWYTLFLSIPTDSIKVSLEETDEGNIKVEYDVSKISVKAVNIDNMSHTTCISIFGSEYSPSEISALTLIATDNIKTRGQNDSGWRSMAEKNLKDYMTNLGTNLGIQGIEVVPAES